MSTESQPISRKEYLQRYMSESDINIKKKRKKPKISTKKILGLKIIDNDIDIKSIDINNDVEDECGEEAPVVAEVIDERPKKVQLREQYHSTCWKRLGSSDEEQSSGNHKKLSSFESPSEKTRHDSDIDLSPVQEATNSSNKLKRETLKSQKIADSDYDFSPPKNRNEGNRNRHDSDYDNSPQRKVFDVSNSEKVHSMKYSGSDSDLSPFRSRTRTIKNASITTKKGYSNNRRRSNSDSDLSPERPSGKQKKNVIIETSSRHSNKGNLKLPKQAFQTQGSDGDFSPPRKTSRFRDSSTDNVYSSRKNAASNSSVNKNEKMKSASQNTDRPSTTLSGMRAGLQNASILREETSKFKKRETKHIMEMNDEISGRNAETIYRNRATGKKRDLREEQRQKQEADQQLAERQQKYSEWGKGLEQRDQQRKRIETDTHEMAKPLARYRDDEDLDRELRNKMHEEDPMFEYIQKKKKIQQNVPEFPKYNGTPAPPNRFNIQPGYRWDGVDRSNGFEKRFFEKVNATKSKETESHLWSVQDM